MIEWAVPKVSTSLVSTPVAASAMAAVFKADVVMAVVTKLVPPLFKKPASTPAWPGPPSKLIFTLIVFDQLGAEEPVASSRIYGLAGSTFIPQCLFLVAP